MVGFQALKQDNHTLKLKLENKTRMEQEYHDEIESLRKAQEERKEYVKLELQYQSEVDSFKKQVDFLTWILSWIFSSVQAR